MGAEPRHNYTAVIYVQIGAALGPNAALYKLVRTITKSQFVERVSLDSPYCYKDKYLYYFSLFAHRSLSFGQPIDRCP